MTIYPADHRLIFFNGTPVEVLLFQSGAQSVTNPSRSAYAQDSCKLRRLTLNVGLRWDWQSNRLNEATGADQPILRRTVSGKKPPATS